MKGKRKTAEKHLVKALILFCDKFCANLKNKPGKQENGSKMTKNAIKRLIISEFDEKHEQLPEYAENTRVLA